MVHSSACENTPQHSRWSGGKERGEESRGEVERRGRREERGGGEGGGGRGEERGGEGGMGKLRTRDFCSGVLQALRGVTHWFKPVICYIITYSNCNVYYDIVDSIRYYVGLNTKGGVDPSTVDELHGFVRREAVDVAGAQPLLDAGLIIIMMIIKVIIVIIIVMIVL